MQLYFIRFGLRMIYVGYLAYAQSLFYQISRQVRYRVVALLLNWGTVGSLKVWGYSHKGLSGGPVRVEEGQKLKC